MVPRTSEGRQAPVLTGIEELPAALRRWREELAELELHPALGASGLAAGVASTIANLERRVREGPHAPLRVAFFGPTGVGKSKLFNSLIGEPLSPSGFRRPFTRHSVYYVHEAWSELAGELPGEVKMHDQMRWRDAILVDTPDFDSVELDNRSEAERIFLETDAFLYVTDGLKYADAASWVYLERIFARGKPCRIIINKVAAAGILEDFRSRLAERCGSEAERAAGIVLPDLPLGDEALLSSEEPGMARLSEAVEELRRGPGGVSPLRAAFSLDLRLLSQQAGGLLEKVQAFSRSLAALRGGLEERYERGGEGLGVGLRTEVDSGLRTEVYKRILQRLERLDIFRYPRRLLALPVQGLRELFRRWWGAAAVVEARPGGASKATESFQLLEAKLLDLDEATRRDIAGDAICGGLLDRDTYLGFRLGHTELEALYGERMAGFTEWVRQEAEGMASSLSGESKLKFILSQVIFNTVLVGVQIHTAGVFTLAELLTDSVVSPLVAKAVGMAISSEQVRAFEARAHARHHLLMKEIVANAQGRFERLLDAAGDGLGPLEALLAEIAAAMEKEEELERAFAAGLFRP
jgi:hypothetical protein